MPPKTNRREIEDSVKNQIIGLRRTGLSGRKIADQLGLIQSTVNRVIKRYKTSGSTENDSRPGRPQKLSECDNRHLVNNIKKNRRSILQDITNEMVSQPSLSTVQRALHEVGLDSRIAAKKPFICARNEEKRLAFALKYQKLLAQDWKHIIWTDESTFEIGKNTRQIRVWRYPSERFDTACITSSFKSGRKSVMVWGCFM